MKKSILLIVLTVFICLFVTGCSDRFNPNLSDSGNSSSSSTTENYLNEKELIFGAGCDYALIRTYFIKKGVKEDDYYTINGTKCSVRYDDVNNKIVVVYVYESTENLSAGYAQLIYKYTYVGYLELKLNQSLANAKYSGYYTHDTVSLNSSGYAYYEAKFTFGNVKYITLTDLCDFDNVSCSGQIVYATDYEKANKHFDKNVIGKTCYQCVEACFVALDDLFKKIDRNYVIADKYVSPNECNHSVVIDEGYPATCLKEGLTNGKHCKKCNTIIEKQEKIPTIDHEQVVDKGYAATCLNEGLTDGKHCKTCKTVTVKQEKIPALHDNISGEECLVCHKMVESKGLEISILVDSAIVRGRGSCMDSCIVIPSEYNNLPVEYIGGEAFKNCTDIEKVIINDNVKYINWSAFENCVSLNEIKLPNTLLEIRESAFSGCKALKSVTIPSNVTGIERYAFYNCNNLISLVFEDISTWYVTTNKNYWENRELGTVTDVSSITDNATCIKNHYDYYWYKK